MALFRASNVINRHNIDLWYAWPCLPVGEFQQSLPLRYCKISFLQNMSTFGGLSCILKPTFDYIVRQQSAVCGTATSAVLLSGHSSMLTLTFCFQSMDMARYDKDRMHTWWHHQMETFSALLALCAGNSPITGEFPFQIPVTRIFDVFFELCLNKWLNNREAGDLIRHRAHYDVTFMHIWWVSRHSDRVIRKPYMGYSTVSIKFIFY